MNEKFNREIDRILDEANSTSLASEEYGKMIARAIAMQKLILEDAKNINEKYRADIQWDTGCKQLDFDKEKFEKELIAQKTAEEAKTISDEKALKKDYIKIGAAMSATVLLALLTVYAEETRVIGSKVGKICGSIVKFI